MKFSCVIFICPFVIALTMAMMQFTHTTFDSCNPDEWIMTNTTCKWINDTKIITSNITYKEADNNKTYTICIVINDCKNRTICPGEPITSVKDVNCEAQNPAQSDMTVCKIANEMGNLGKDQEFFESRYGLENEKNKKTELLELLLDSIICVKIDDVDVLWNDTEFK